MNHPAIFTLPPMPSGSSSSRLSAFSVSQVTLSLPYLCYRSMEPCLFLLSPFLTLVASRLLSNRHFQVPFSTPFILAFLLPSFSRPRIAYQPEARSMNNSRKHILAFNEWPVCFQLACTSLLQCPFVECCPTRWNVLQPSVQVFFFGPRFGSPNRTASLNDTATELRSSSLLERLCFQPNRRGFLGIGRSTFFFPQPTFSPAPISPI